MILKIYKNYKGLISNIASLSVLKIIDLVIPLLLFPYLVGVVGEKNYGIYAFAYTLIFYFLNVSQYGFSLSAVKTIALVKEDQKQLAKIFNEVFITKLFLTTLSLSIILGLVFFIPQFRENYLVFLFVSIILIGDTLTSTWFFQGIEKMQYITLINLVSKLSFVGMAILLITTKNDYVYIGLYHALGYIIAGILSLVLLIKKHKIKLEWVPFTAVKRQLKLSFSSFLILITPTLYSSSSIMMLGFFSSYQYVTYLEAGMKISGMFSGVNNVLTTALYPFINRNLKYKKKSIQLLLITGVFFSATMYFLSSLIVDIWLDKVIYEVVIVIKILSFSPLMLAFISAYGVNKLLIENKDALFLKATFISSIIGLFLGYVLISRFDLYGAAMTIIVTRIIYAIYTYLYAKK